MLKKNFVYIVLIAVALTFATMDFIFNGYIRFFFKPELLIEQTDNITNIDLDVEAPITTQIQNDNIFIKQLKNQFSTLSIKETKKSNIIFSRLDLSIFALDVTNKTIINNENESFIDFYELSGGTPTYFKIKDWLDFVLQSSETESLYEANSFWDYSFYYNDSNRPNKVFLIALINKHVIGLEYNKKFHENIKNILWIVSQN